jgi:hypothetical protein
VAVLLQALVALVEGLHEILDGKLGVGGELSRGEGSKLLDLPHVELSLGDAHGAFVQQPLGGLGSLLQALRVGELLRLELLDLGLKLGKGLLGLVGGGLGLGNADLGSLGGALGDTEVLEPVLEALLALGDLGAEGGGGGGGRGGEGVLELCLAPGEVVPDEGLKLVLLVGGGVEDGAELLDLRGVKRRVRIGE